MQGLRRPPSDEVPSAYGWSISPAQFDGGSDGGGGRRVGGVTMPASSSRRTGDVRIDRPSILASGAASAFVDALTVPEEGFLGVLASVDVERDGAGGTSPRSTVADSDGGGSATD